MNFKFRDDIVLEKVAGVNMLIAKRSAWGICPFIVEIGPMEAYFWKALNERKEEKEIIAHAVDKWKVTHAAAEKFFNTFVNGIKKSHYLENTEYE